MSSLDIRGPNEAYITQYVIERKAEELYNNRLYDKCFEKVQKLIDNSESNADKGWYLQLMANYKYEVDKSKAMSTQLKAHTENEWLFIPEGGIRYEKISSGEKQNYTRIIDWIKTHRGYNDLIVEVESYLDKLVFGGDSNLFEEGIDDLGKILGFVTQRPEKWGDGPDNFWICGTEYLIIECKNDVKEDRLKIFKHETGQLNNSIIWFNKNYPGVIGKPIIIHPSKELAKGAHLPDEVKVLVPEKLDLLKANIRNFFTKLSSRTFETLDGGIINKNLTDCKLLPNDIYAYYCKKIIS